MAKRIAAWICIALLLGIYILTFVLALFVNPENGMGYFMGAVGCTVFIPILAWFYIRMFSGTHVNDNNNNDTKEND